MSAADGLLVCSHRGPFTFEPSRKGPVAKRGGGGLIGAVEPVIAEMGGTWIAAALSDTDRALGEHETEGFRMRFLDLPRDVHRSHYELVSNEYLWFLFHYLFDVPKEPVFGALFSEAWDDYRTINALYADAAAAAPGRVVLIEDYHLMLAGSYLRKRSRARRPLLYFHHTPWCEPAYFSILPDDVGAEILEAMLAYDVVGFHAKRWADAFLACCERFVRGASVHGDEIRWKNRTTQVLTAPVPIDQQRLQRSLDEPVTRQWVASHEEMRSGRKLLLRVDRIDLSKNPLRGFLAYEQLLDHRPKLAQEVLFLALLYPSRSSVESYQRYYTECLGVVRRINERFDAKADVGPVHLVFEDDFHRSLAAMELFDVLLVNPVFDGLNLVCKEGAFVNQQAGTVILSRNAGAFEELEGAVTPLNPFDVGATAEAIEAALALDDPARAKRSKKLKRLATASTPTEWLAKRLAAAGA